MYSFFDASSADWVAQVDDLCVRLAAPDNAFIFPRQFLQVTLPAIGGALVVAGNRAAPLAVGFLFPRDVQAGKKVYTLRYHMLAGDTQRDVEALAAAAAQRYDAIIVPYDPLGAQRFAASHEGGAGCDIGAPDEHEAAQLPTLQSAIWQAGAGFLYPADIHSLDFHLATSLVARVHDRIAGMAFGFYRFGKAEAFNWWGDHRADLRIESQILGVDPEARRLGLGFQLKRRQREQALAQGIDIIHWTVDPLQYPNAVLNIVKLGALAFDFYPNYYPFRNALNQVAPSRFRLTWLLRAPRVVKRVVQEGRNQRSSLESFPGVHVFEEGATLERPVNAPFIAIEIPADWTALQANDLERAQRWRATSDALFGQLVGIAPGQYGIHDVAAAGERRFLIGRRCDDTTSLFEEL